MMLPSSADKTAVTGGFNGLIGVPTAAETIMLERDMRLVALTSGRYHAAAFFGK